MTNPSATAPAPTFTPVQHACPHCGYCPHCGRSNATPHHPVPYTLPWGTNPYPYPYTVWYGTYTVGSSAANDPTIVNYC